MILVRQFIIFLVTCTIKHSYNILRSSEIIWLIVMFHLLSASSRWWLVQTCACFDCFSSNARNDVGDRRDKEHNASKTSRNREESQDRKTNEDDSGDKVISSEADAYRLKLCNWPHKRNQEQSNHKRIDGINCTSTVEESRK